MCKKPVRLEKQECKHQTIDFICALARTPEFWLFILIAIIFILLIIIAIKESQSGLWYNTGLKSTL